MSKAPPTEPRASTGTLVPHGLDALHGEEVARAHGYSLTLAVLCSIGLAFMPVLPTTMAMRLLFAAGGVPIVGLSIWVFLRTRREASYTPTLYRVYGWGAAILSLPILYVVGLFSPAPLCVMLGLMFFALSADSRHAVALSLLCIAEYVLLGLAVVTGLVKDRGLFPADDVSQMSRVFILVMVSLMYLGTLYVGRVSRRSLVLAVRRASEAQVMAAARKANMLEAQQELEQALGRRAPGSGRFTGADAGGFRLDTIIGRGAMGEVYRGIDGDGSRLAAVKVMTLDAAAPDAGMHVERFLREAEILKRLDGPAFARLYNAGTVRAMGVEAPYLAMELLEGEDLAARLRRQERLSAEEVADLLNQVGPSLTAAHAAGVVHRDLKPQNLFAARVGGGKRESWKVLDFGVSRLAGAEATLTRAQVIGTPGYMAPEQALGRPVDGRADVFALGAVAYRALTGRPAFSGRTTPEVMYAVVNDVPPRPSSVVRDLPAALDGVLAQAMAKGAAERHETPSALAAAFAAAVRR